MKGHEIRKEVEEFRVNSAYGAAEDCFLQARYSGNIAEVKKSLQDLKKLSTPPPTCWRVSSLTRAGKTRS